MLCFDPTRGIDIRTKREIYQLLRELAAQGASVLLYTSELEEVQLACDRAVVIFGGRVVDELPADDGRRAGADARRLWAAARRKRVGRRARRRALGRRRASASGQRLIRFVARNGWVIGPVRAASACCSSSPG